MSMSFYFDKEAYTYRRKGTEMKAGHVAVFVDITRRGPLPKKTYPYSWNDSNKNSNEICSFSHFHLVDCVP